MKTSFQKFILKANNYLLTHQKKTSVTQKLKRLYRKKSGMTSKKDVVNLLTKHNPDLLALINTKKPSELSGDELREVVRIIRFTNEHLLYERILNNYDPDLKLISNLYAKASTFLIAGNGKGVLNSYRKIDTSECSLFEKIYLKDSPNLTRNLWFINNIEPLLDPSQLKTPSTYKIMQGRKLTAIYTEFLDIKKAEEKEVAYLSIKVSLYLYRLNLPNDLSNLPATILSFKSAEIYQRSTTALKLFLETLKIDSEQFISQLNTYLNQVPKRFCHGDLNQVNITKSGLVIDWDECGIYPIGYDIALALSRSYRPKDANALKAYLRKNCLQFIPPNLHKTFLESTLYLCLIFYSTKLNKNASSALLTDLLNTTMSFRSSPDW